MGMYTELNIGVEFKEDIPSEVVEVLEAMTGDVNLSIETSIDHPLFKTSRWRWMLHLDSYSFDAIPCCKFEFDDISSTYFLTSISNLKNYESEIELFLHFIAPYLRYSTKTFIGYKRHEEDEEPTLLYADGKSYSEWCLQDRKDQE